MGHPTSSPPAKGSDDPSGEVHRELPGVLFAGRVLLRERHQWGGEQSYQVLLTRSPWDALGSVL